MPFQFSVPTTDNPKQFEFVAGETIIFVGANGGGKTRLTVHIENVLGILAHRISAHRALTMNPTVAKISEKKALAGLRVGHADEKYLTNIGQRTSSRWGQKGATHLLNDFDYLVQALFAEQSNTALQAYQRHKPGAEATEEPFQTTKFDSLVEIWRDLLPHRQLHISGDDIVVSISGSDTTYPAADMSDGERAIFYMIGQALVAADNTVMIVDEPELHVHRSIMSKLWDAIEAARPDCGFVFITHDLEFAASRAAQKFVIKDYSPAPAWEIESVPEDSGFGEELTTLILGSRKPVLFIEGTHDSLDFPIYRACYPEWTVVPRSSCISVIHSVVTMRKNADLTRITCSGIVDGDDYEEEDKQYFHDLGILVLPVSEIENLVLLPDVSKAIAETEGYVGDDLKQKLDDLSEAVFASLDTSEKIEKVAVDYCRRRIDRILKKIDLSAGTTVETIRTEFTNRTTSLDIEGIATNRVEKIRHAIASKDLPALLALYDNKGLLALAASSLKGYQLSKFEGWITRSLRNNSCPALTDALANYLPSVEPQ